MAVSLTMISTDRLEIISSVSEWTQWIYLCSEAVFADPNPHLF